MARVRVQVRVLCIWVRVRVLTKGLESESESLKIWTRVRLEYTVGLEYYISGNNCIRFAGHLITSQTPVYTDLRSSEVICGRTKWSAEAVNYPSMIWQVIRLSRSSFNLELRSLGLEKATSELLNSVCRLPHRKERDPTTPNSREVLIPRLICPRLAAKQFPSEIHSSSSSVHYPCLSNQLRWVINENINL